MPTVWACSHSEAWDASRLQTSQGAPHLLDVAADAKFMVLCGAYHFVAVDHVRDAPDAEAKSASCPVEPNDAVPGIRQEPEGQIEGVPKRALPVRWIRTDAQDRGAEGADDFEGFTEVVGLAGSARGEGLREEIQDEGAVDLAQCEM